MSTAVMSRLPSSKSQPLTGSVAVIERVLWSRGLPLTGCLVSLVFISDFILAFLPIAFLNEALNLHEAIALVVLLIGTSLFLEELFPLERVSIFESEPALVLARFVPLGLVLISTRLDLVFEEKSPPLIPLVTIMSLVAAGLELRLTALERLMVLVSEKLARQLSVTLEKALVSGFWESSTIISFDSS